MGKGTLESSAVPLREGVDSLSHKTLYAPLVCIPLSHSLVEVLTFVVYSFDIKSVTAKNPY